MTTEEATLEFIKENLAEIRHTEDHRNNITSVILVIVGAILAFVSSKEDLADQIIHFISFFVILLGSFGAFVTRKLYERQKWYMGRVELLYEKIDHLDKALNIKELYSLHAADHKKKFRRFSKVRMNVLWTFIHIGIILIGIGLLFAKN